MRVILLGGPGAGKGTQAAQIAEHFSIPQISTGDMLRMAISQGSDLGMRAKAVMDSGALVSDEIILGLVKERITGSDCNRGFLFDGFPRTVPQAEALRTDEVKIDHIVEIVVDDTEIVRRMSGRRVHLASGRTYHVEFNPPRVSGKDDNTGEVLVQREDDKTATVKRRLDVYHQQTEPLVHYYETWSTTEEIDAPSYIRIDGEREVTSVTQDIMDALK